MRRGAFPVMARKRKELNLEDEFFRTRAEEWANAMSHLVGLVFGIVGLTLMCVFAAQRGTARHVVACAVYGTTLVFMFNSSMLYHLIKPLKVKRVFQIMDHVSIYLLIAGSYTPFTLLALSPRWGWTIFGIIWGLCVLGVLCDVFYRREWLAMLVCLIMGWLIALVFKQLCASLSTAGLALLVTGGGVYTLGVIFYAMDRVPYMHTVWHFFVLGGVVCHWVAVTFCLIPG